MGPPAPDREGEIGRRITGRTWGLKVGWTCGSYRGEGAQPSRDQAGVRQLAHTERAVNSLLNQVHRTVPKAKHKFDVRVPFAELLYARHHDHSPG
ncbi:hypothetical protein P3T22_006051 [Paraburkholderia sp. GAS348]